MSTRRELIDLQVYNKSRKVKVARKQLKNSREKQRIQYFKIESKPKQIKQTELKHKERERLLISQIFPEKSDEIRTNIMDSDSSTPQKYDYLFSLKKIKEQERQKSFDKSFQSKKDLDIQTFFPPQFPVFYYFKKKDEKQKKQEKQRLRSFPVLNKSKDHKQSMFSLECDQPSLPQHVIKSISDFQKLTQKLMARFQNTEIRVPKPTGTYCWICRSHYQPEDYLTHIKSRYHLQKDKSTQIWKQIKKIITRVNMQNNKSQAEKNNSVIHPNTIIRQTSKQIFQQIQKREAERQAKKRGRKPKIFQVQKNNMDKYLKKSSFTLTLNDLQRQKSQQKSTKQKQIDTIQYQKSRSKSRQKKPKSPTKNVKQETYTAKMTQKQIDFGLQKTRSAQKKKKKQPSSELEKKQVILTKIQKKMFQLKKKMESLQNQKNQVNNSHKNQLPLQA